MNTLVYLEVDFSVPVYAVGKIIHLRKVVTFT